MIDPSVDELLKLFAERGYSIAEDLPRAPKGKWAVKRSSSQHTSGYLFARLALLLAMHDFEFPLGLDGTAVDQAFTEGDGDLGLDGVAIAIGNQAVRDLQQAQQIIESDPEAPVRILLLQAKRRGENGDMRDIVWGQDVAKFGMDASIWLRGSEADIKARMGRHHNTVAWRQWRTYDAIRTAVTASTDPNSVARIFAPEIVLVFAYSGYWKESDTPVLFLRETEDRIQSKFPDARVHMDIWGAQDIAAAADYARIGLKRVLKKFNAVEMQAAELPAEWIDADAGGSRTAKCFYGHMLVPDLLDAFSRPRRRGSRPSLDYRFFLDNPRAYLKLVRSRDGGRSDDWNRGARSIEETVKTGMSGVLGFGHNGVVVVAREATRNGENLELVGPQVVNGCQSCFTLDDMRDKAGNAFLPVRVVVTDSEDLTTFIVRASNTQAPLDEWDLTLGRSAEILALQRAFMHGLSDAPDRVWLQRRWNDPLGEIVDYNRTVQARQLLEASAASFLGGPQRNSKDLLERIGEDIFTANHEPTAYRAAAWLFIVYERWRADLPRGTYNLFAARYQVVHALWRLADEAPDSVNLERGQVAKARFQRLIDLLVKDAASTDHPWASRAAACVERAWSIKNPSSAGTIEFTKLVRALADEERARISGAGALRQPA